MATTEHPDEGVFNGASEITIRSWVAGVETLLSFRTLSDESQDREVLISHKKGSTYTPLAQRTIPGVSTGAKDFAIELPVHALDAADESIVATLNGSGGFRWAALWLLRT